MSRPVGKMNRPPNLSRIRPRRHRRLSRLHVVTRGELSGLSYKGHDDRI